MQPPPNQPPYGQPPHGQPLYGQPGWGQPWHYGQPGHGPSPYGPPGYGPPPVQYDPAEVQARINGFNQKSFLLGVPGLLLQFAGNVLSTSHSAVLGSLCTLVGTGLLIGGLAYYAKSRGQNGLFGLLGLLSCIGLIILFVIPRKCLVCAGSVTNARCNQCGAPGAT